MRVLERREFAVQPQPRWEQVDGRLELQRVSVQIEAIGGTEVADFQGPLTDENLAEIDAGRWTTEILCTHTPPTAILTATYWVGETFWEEESNRINQAIDEWIHEKGYRVILLAGPVGPTAGERAYLWLATDEEVIEAHQPSNLIGSMGMVVVYRGEDPGDSSEPPTNPFSDLDTIPNPTPEDKRRWREELRTRSERTYEPVSGVTIDELMGKIDEVLKETD